MVSRRWFITGMSAFGLLARQSAAATKSAVTAEEWMQDAVITKGSNSPLKLQRFLEPVWVLIEPIEWTPNQGQHAFPSVKVPANFVTDLASIPSPFWSLLPRDGQYAYSAIVHDFMYWDQSRKKDEADQILKWSMEDLEVSKADVTAIYAGVRSRFGQRAWKKNAQLKMGGEKRILLEPPPAANTRWSDWKKDAKRFI